MGDQGRVMGKMGMQMGDGVAPAARPAQVDSKSLYTGSDGASQANLRRRGASIGGTLYKKLGVIEPYETEDLGRFEITKAEEDKYVFKVSMLRNIAETGPYLHDGSVATLEEVVKIMAEYQLGQTLSDEDTADIVAFMKALTGDLPLDYIAPPTLPENGPDTPPPPTEKHLTN